jgi:hypothetical protein
VKSTLGVKKVSILISSNEETFLSPVHFLVENKLAERKFLPKFCWKRNQLNNKSGKARS